MADYRDKRGRVREVVDSLEGFSGVVVPDTADVSARKGEMDEVSGYLTRRLEALGAIQRFDGFEDHGLPDTDALDQVQATIKVVTDLRKRRLSANTDLTAASTDAKHNAKLLAEAEAEVTRLLGDRGVCPTCNTVHEGGVHV